MERKRCTSCLLDASHQCLQAAILRMVLDVSRGSRFADRASSLDDLKPSSELMMPRS
jgi:hypothetical protein